MCTILCRCGAIRTVRPYRDTRTLDGLCSVHLQEAKVRFFSNVPITPAPAAVKVAVAKLSLSFKKRSA